MAPLPSGRGGCQRRNFDKCPVRLKKRKIMGKYQKLIFTILTAQADNKIKFIDLCNLLKRLGFEERVRGSHHIFRKD